MILDDDSVAHLLGNRAARAEGIALFPHLTWMYAAIETLTGKVKIISVGSGSFTGNL